ncbi:hypothetical protein COW36_06220 [bacterium (Candidatus Blackallbacteria) CG17_big_fil_post_rev_8_21_14_2_50_48_46]|uniref:Tetratricopeptide repeat protein n=1 Tax=bacterium (Candidatus Blackallbacteria) CG17_big_fil_post_rev_8_21_14_2_50_48_46 TaxID=2014261 RepID=A0A2M7G7R2_9BACT|nr:MAG: hypothetical protein COW64_17050 [bacterium (Candidatus Blackallbacteria) CG18_big_fil_WC_8_21_14_2_50_49_26]PIW18122.1 MAG: hypothetical protein COW36_06220 [bacterium (Candidatus Blackallbacteria) CG17_big_fil_post_rev_8_21_14_2_50_48_46]PIW51131.1 MAG: hypothetical protein COW20_00370 [bacterium (Candidatus Blackallbacteria) CG13_big_fil_rev_8_21_14_2_50_49_14]
MILRAGRFLLLAWLLLVLKAAVSPEQQLYEQGLLLLQKGYYQEARSYFEQANQKDPGNPDILFSLGVAFYQLKDYQQAYRVYRLAMKQLPALELKGHLQGAIGDIFYQLEDFAEAVGYYQQALFVHSRSKGLRLRLALSYLKLQNYAAANVETERLIKDYPLLNEAWRLRSLIRLAQADYGEALKDFEKSLLNQPVQDFESLAQLNWLYRLNHDFDSAKKIAFQLVNLQAKMHPEAYLIAGDTLFENLTRCQSGQICDQAALAEASVSFYQKYTLAEPQQALGHYKLGKLYLWLMEPQTARTFFRQAALLFPEHRNYQFAWIEAEMACGDWFEADKQFKNFVFENNRSEDLEFLVKMEETGFSFSLPQLSEGTDLQNKVDLQGVYFLRGYLKYLKTRQLNLAQHDWLLAEQKNPQSAMTDLIRALRMSAHGQDLWAGDFLKQAIRKQPEWWLPYQLMGQLMRRQQKHQDALWYLEQSLHWNPLARSVFFEVLDLSLQLKDEVSFKKTLNYALRIFPNEPKFQTYYWKSLEKDSSL